MTSRTSTRPWRERIGGGASTASVLEEVIDGADDPVAAIMDAARLAATDDEHAAELWPLRFAMLEWLHERRAAVPDAMVFSPFARRITTRLVELSGRPALRIGPHPDRDDSYYDPKAERPDQLHPRPFHVRWLSQVLSTRPLCYVEPYAEPQGFSLGTDTMLLKGQPFIQWGWLDSFQRHVLLPLEPTVGGMDPQVRSADHEGPMTPFLEASLGEYLKRLSAAER